MNQKKPKKMENNIFLFFWKIFFYDKKKSAFDSIISVIDPCGEI